MPKTLLANDPAEGEGLGPGFIQRTVAQIDRFLGGGGRMVSSTSTALSLTATQHAERLVLWEPNSNGAATATLPDASGSGDKYRLVNGLVQTQGSLVVAALGTDVIRGKAVALDSTAAADANVFLTTATSDKITFNRTTTGGLGYDEVIAEDVAEGVWLVDVVFNGSGTLATPFSAT